MKTAGVYVMGEERFYDNELILVKKGYSEATCDNTLVKRIERNHGNSST